MVLERPQEGVRGLARHAFDGARRAADGVQRALTRDRMGAHQRMRHGRHGGRLRVGELLGRVFAIASSRRPVEVNRDQPVDARARGLVEIVVGGLHVENSGLAAHIWDLLGVQHGRAGNVGLVGLVRMPEDGGVPAVFPPASRHVSHFEEIRVARHPCRIDDVLDRDSPLAAEPEIRVLVAVLLLQDQQAMPVERLRQREELVVSYPCREVHAMDSLAERAVEWFETNHGETLVSMKRGGRDPMVATTPVSRNRQAGADVVTYPLPSLRGGLYSERHRRSQCACC